MASTVHAGGWRPPSFCCFDGRMKCPNDQATLVMSDRNGIEIDYCPDCRGVWLDRGELDKIIDRAGTGAPASAAPAPPSATYGQPGYADRAYDDRRDDRGYGDRRGDDRGYGDRRYDDRGDYGRRRKKENWLSELFD